MHYNLTLICRLTATPEPVPNHYYIPFRGDMLKIGIAPFDIVGKVGNKLWGKFLSEVAAVGVYNDRFDFIFDHKDSSLCLLLHMFCCCCALPRILNDAEFYPPRFFEKWCTFCLP